MLTTAQVLASHEAALGEQDPAKVSTHYAKDAVAVINGHTYRGPLEIETMYHRLIRDFPDATWRTHVTVIHEDLAYTEWACESATANVEFGTDTFVVANGLIERQTARFVTVANT